MNKQESGYRWVVLGTVLFAYFLIVCQRTAACVVLQKEPITSPIIGSTKMSHLENAVTALSTTLTPEEIAFLEEPYLPYPMLGLD
jgi:1-deoxyxylulose-5-phosphate synthase